MTRYYSCVTKVLLYNNDISILERLRSDPTIETTVPWFLCFAVRLILERKRASAGLQVVDCLLDNPHLRRPSMYVRPDDFSNIALHVLLASSDEDDRRVSLLLIQKIARNFSKYQTFLVTSICQVARNRSGLYEEVISVLRDL